MLARGLGGDYGSLDTPVREAAARSVSRRRVMSLQSPGRSAGAPARCASRPRLAALERRDLSRLGDDPDVEVLADCP